MTTARDVIAQSISRHIAAPHAIADIVLTALLSAPDSIRQELNPWRPIETAPKDGTIFDAWLGDASEEDVEFYCTPDTRRSPSWKWYNGKFRPVGGLTPHAVLVTLVQPTHWLPLPAPPSEDKT